MGRSPCCDKSKVKRGTWSPEEDEILKNYLQNHGTAGNWIALPQKAGLKRCGKSCRLRWMNYLRPDIKHGDFTQDEEHIICKLYNNIGSRWSVIASHLPGRTDNDVKNYWNTKLKKKFMETTAFQIAPHQRERVANDELINFGSSRFIQGGRSSDCSSGGNGNSNDMNSRSYPPYLLEQADFWLGRDEVELLVRGIWGEEEEAEVDADLFSIFHADSTLHGATQTHSPTPL